MINYLAHQILSKKASQDASKSINETFSGRLSNIFRQKATRNLNSGEAEPARENVEDQENNDPNDGFKNGDEDVSTTTDCAEARIAQDHQLVLDELVTIVEALE